MNPNPLKTAISCFLLIGVWTPGAQAAITVTHGDFEDGLTGQQNNVQNWFERSTAPDFIEWTNPDTSIFGDVEDGYTPSRHLAIRGDGYVYQSLGIYGSSDGNVLNWSLYQGVFSDGNASAGVTVTIYSGAFPGAAEGVDISTAGLAQVGVPMTFAALGSGFNSSTGPAAAGFRTGTLSLASLSDGTELWARISGNGGSGVFAPIDNFSVSQVPEPGNVLLSMLGITALIAKRRRRVPFIPSQS